MFKRPVLLSLFAALLAALPHQAMLGSMSPAAGPRPVKQASQATPRISPVSSEILLKDGFALLPVGMGWWDGSKHGNWRDRFGGFGKVGISVDGSRVQASVPRASKNPGETHAALVTSVKSFGNMDVTVKMKTIKQLRSPHPNPWEMAWVLWHYTDDVHFYYVVLKTNGWELGKEDPAYRGNQRFLLTQSYPKFQTGVWYVLHIRQVGPTITVWVGKTLLGSYTDQDRPYTVGSLGLYCEDSYVHFDNVLVTKP
jgi:hypothetical protein